MTDLKVSIQENLKKCSRCGGCRAVCPIYKVGGHEVDVARGKVQLAKALQLQELTLAGDLPYIMQQCLLCRACTVNCPSAVETADLVIDIRKHIIAEHGLSLTKRGILSGLLYGEKIPAAAKAIFNLALIDKLALTRGLPTLETRNVRKMLRSLLKDLKGEEQPHGFIFKPVNPKLKLGLFYGCADAQFSHQRIKELIKILLLNDIAVYVPAQKCCGLPFSSAGLEEKQKELTEYNVDKFAGLTSLDGIITACSSCASSLKAQGFKQKVYDVVEFLNSYPIKKPKGFSKQVRYAYHHPCHAVRYQQLTKDVSELLVTIGGLQDAELQAANECCGGGGTFSFEQARLAEKIGLQKAENIVQSQAEIVITSCPGCMMQISSALNNIKSNIPVKHLVSVLYEAYGLD